MPRTLRTNKYGALVFACFGFGAAACGGATPTLGNQNYDAEGAQANYVGAASTAAIAGAAWIAGGGCKLQGCPYGSYCNEKSGYCEVRTCSEGCPEGTVCNEGLDRCQVAPPAQAPSDRLPMDDKRNPPNTH